VTYSAEVERCWKGRGNGTVKVRLRVKVKVKANPIGSCFFSEMRPCAQGARKEEGRHGDRVKDEGAGYG